MPHGLAFPFHPAEDEPEAYGQFSSPYQFFTFSVPLIPFRFKWLTRPGSYSASEHG
jgi:hypothetical protein